MPGLRPIPVAVNISAVEFRSGDLLKTVVATLTAAGLDPCFLELELTESALMAPVSATAAVLHPLKRVGVQDRQVFVDELMQTDSLLPPATPHA
jgi:EAL domain-containing protein (putative c-di-GMP-specific phosphodiesterase class I)